jgi:Uma2 family endonuclease
MVDTAKILELAIEEENDEGIPADWVTGAPQGQWTYEAYYAIPDDGNRYEVIDGVLYLMASPETDHQSVANLIATYLTLHVQFQNLGRIMPAPYDVILPDGTIVQPDISVIFNANQKVLTKKRLEGAPDLVVEVASPSTAGYDRKKKRAVYAKAGVREYWIVRPSKKNVELFVLEQGELVSRGVFKGQTVLPSQIVPNFPVQVAQFFE